MMLNPPGKTQLFFATTFLSAALQCLFCLSDMSDLLYVASAEPQEPPLQAVHGMRILQWPFSVARLQCF
jgi:hypothetical protein